MGSDHNFAAKRSAAPVGRAAGTENSCSDPENARSRISLLYSRASLLMRSGAALSPRRATYFSLLRQRNLRKRKATLVSAQVCNAQAGSGWDSKAVSCQSIAIIFIAAYAHIDWARGLNGSINRPFEDCCKQETRDDRFRCCIYSSTPSVCAEERRARRIRARDCLRR